MNIFKLALAKGAQPSEGAAIMICVKHRTGLQIKIPALMFAIASVSACSSAPTGLTAGGPTPSHAPQNYETLTSTAAVTSTLGGSVLNGGIDPVTHAFVVAVSSSPLTGSLTHDTGSVTMNDGTYLFVDNNGPDINGNLADGTGATALYRLGDIGVSFGTYDYVDLVGMYYTIAGVNYGPIGVVGMITDSGDLPVAGSAAYMGEAFANWGAVGGTSVADQIKFENGASTVNVNFAASTAGVTLNNFSNISDGAGAVVSVVNTPFDEVQGTGMAISGAHFSGGAWVTLKGGVVVNVVGAGVTTTSDGTFFGYDPSISAPDEVGGVAYIDGSTANVVGLYLAD